MLARHLRRADPANCGPRIFPVGAIISQTSGHGDFRFQNALPMMPSDPADYALQQGMSALADGVSEVLRRTREQLMKGASQIKITAGGGVASQYDPLESLQFTEDEMRAAGDAKKYTDPKAVAAQKQVAEGTMRAFEWADKHRVNWAFGTDILYGGGESQARQLTKLTRCIAPPARRASCWRFPAAVRLMTAGSG